MATPDEVAPRRIPDVHLNLSVRGMGSSATVAINDRCNALRARGQTVYKLGLGQSPFPVPESVVEALRLHAPCKDYLPTPGLMRLREAVAGYHQRVHDVSVRPQHVLIAPGSKELMFILQLVYYGDILIPTPAWVSYAPQARIAGRQVLFIPTEASNGWALQPEELEEHCADDRDRPRILILNYPSNPTGGTFDGAQLEALADVARRYRLVILSDEIYGELHHEGQHRSIARYYPEGTIVSSGLSKWCGAGGWRLGTFTFPETLGWLFEAMSAVASETYTTTSAPIQYAAVRAFEGGLDIERYLLYSRRILKAMGQHIHSRLQAAGLRVQPAAGAFYLFPDFEPYREALALNGIRTGRQLCERLLEESGVAILPGEVFGRSRQELTARLAYVDFDGARALMAAADLDEQNLAEPFLRTYATPVMHAIDRLCGWLEALPSA